MSSIYLDIFFSFLDLVAIVCLYKIFFNQPVKIRLYEILLAIFFSVVFQSLVHSKIYIDYYYMMFVVDNVMLFLFISLFSKKKGLVIIFFVLLCNAIHFNSILLISMFESYILGIDLYDLNQFNLASFLDALFIYMISTATAYLFIKNLKQIKKYIERKKTIIVLSSLIMIQLSGCHSLKLLYEGGHNVSISVFCDIFSFFALLYFVAELINTTEEKNQVQYENALSKIQLQYLQKVKEENEEMQMLRHDLKNNLLIIQGLLERKQPERAQEFIQKMNHQWIQSENTVRSGNVFIDTIIDIKKKQYSSIDFHLTMQVNAYFHDLSNDICTLLMNVIDNACTELEQVNQKDFYLKIKCLENNFLLEARNACREKQTLISNRGRMHGYGLKIIKRIVEENHGTLEIHHDQEFIISIAMFNQ